MPKHVLRHLQKVRIFQQPLGIRRDTGLERPSPSTRPTGRPLAGKPNRFHKGKKPTGKPGKRSKPRKQKRLSGHF